MERDWRRLCIVKAHRAFMRKINYTPIVTEIGEPIANVVAIWGGALLLAACLTPAASRGEPITEPQARAAVEGWLRQDIQPLGAELSTDIRSVLPYSAEDAEPAYYVADLAPSGFAIVSADDLVEPIIAFAAVGSYDSSAKNPLGAMVSRDLPFRVKEARLVAAELKSGKRTALEARFQNSKDKWSRLWQTDKPAKTSGGIQNPSDPVVDPLVQSRWSQETSYGNNACYNYYTPQWDGQQPVWYIADPANYPCGCVATAMAQLMRFYQHPVAGVGTATFPVSVCGWSTSRALRGGNGLGGSYFWSQMVLVPSSSTTAVQREAIGALCYDAGVSVNMDYCYNGSGTDLLLAGNAFRNTFGYANATKGHNGGADIGTGLNAMVNPNLDAGYPVLLGVLGYYAGGHAIVCDGYGYNVSSLYHHLNLGWAGTDDAWYALPNIETSVYTFSLVRKCIYNVFVTGSGEIISGRVRDGYGNPVSGASVTATRTGGGSYSASTNPRGVFALAKVLAASQYTITVAKAGYTFPTRVVTTGTSTDNGSVSGNVWIPDFVGTGFAVGSITPNFGSGGTVHISNLAGSGFQSGATTRLSRTGYSDINGTSVVVVNSNKISCDFNISSATPGAWDVVVVNPSGKLAELSSGFMVGQLTDGGTEPCLTLDRSGAVHVVHLIDYGSVSGRSSYVKYTRITDTSWSTENVASVAEQSYGYPWIGVGAADKPHIGYVELWNYGRIVHQERGTSWTPETVASGAINADVGMDGMAMAVKSNVCHFLYEQIRNSGYDDGLAYKIKTGTTWSSQTLLETDNFNNSMAAMVDSSTNLHAIYALGDDIYYRKRNPAGSWERSLVHAGVGGWYQGRGGVALDSTGKVHVVYAGDNLGNKPYYANNVSGSWSVKGVIDNSANCDSGFARIACGPNNSLHVAYFDYNTHKTKYAILQGTNWVSNPVADMDDYGGPDIAVDSQGTVHIVYAYDEKLCYLKFPSYQTLTVGLTPTNGGTVAPTAGTHSYVQATPVTVTATPNAGWQFSYWTGDVPAGMETTNRLTLLMDAAKAVVAHFTPYYYLTSSASPSVGGTVTRTPDKTAYSAAELVQLQAISNAPYRFVLWSGDVPAQQVITNPLSITMDTNRTVVAVFAVPPSITTHPASKAVTNGGNAAFSVVATGSVPLSYQWCFYGTNLNGATGSVYTRTNAQPADEGPYSVVVSNIAGSVASSNAALTVYRAPMISLQPQSQSVALGSNALFTIFATGTAPLGYQWRFIGTNINGATSASYTRFNVQTNHAGDYSVVISNIAGAATSDPATLTVLLPIPLRFQTIASLPGGGIRLVWSGDTNSPGILQGSSNLSSWWDLGPGTATNGYFEFLDFSASNAFERSYRTRN